MRNCPAHGSTRADRIGDRNSATRPIRGYGSLALLLNLPDHDGFSVLAELRRHYPDISVVVLPARQYCATVAKALGLRACGFIPGSDDSDVISAAQPMADGAIDVPAEIFSRDDPRFAELLAQRPFPSRPRI